MLDCFVYELSSDDALEELIRTHRASRGLTDFVRIELALDLEPHFQVKALKNQQAGGQGKGLSKLTKAQRLDTQAGGRSGCRRFFRKCPKSEEHFDPRVFILAAGCERSKKYPSISPTSGV